MKTISFPLPSGPWLNRRGRIEICCLCSKNVNEKTCGRIFLLPDMMTIVHPDDVPEDFVEQGYGECFIGPECAKLIPNGFVAAQMKGGE